MKSTLEAVIVHPSTMAIPGTLPEILLPEAEQSAQNSELVAKNSQPSERPRRSRMSPEALAATQSSQVLDGLWWKQEPGVTGFVALANSSSAKLTATVQVTDPKGVSLATHSVTVSPHGTKTLQLSELEYATGSSGGIHVMYNGGVGDLLVFGGLEDQNSGYSAGLGFRAPPAAAAKPAEMSYAALGLMAGAADPMMNFPVGSVFAPYSVLRNISDAPATATPTLWWMASGTAHSYQLPALTLSPGESTRLDVPALITAAGLSNFNGNLNLAVNVQGKPGALLQVAGSVDHSNSYVFEVSPRAIVESASKSLAYWSTANGDDTMMTLWNPADEAQDFVFRVTFTGGHYSLPIHLEPRATRTLNLSEVIQNQIPDAEGNVIPLSIHEGSGKIAGAHADNEHILLAADVGIYNVKKATCGLVCFTCDGADTASVTPSPFEVTIDGQQQMDFTVTWDTGQQYDLTSQSSWFSNNGTGSVSVSSSGLVQGQTAGTTNVGASDNSEPVYSTVCLPLPADNPCPVDFGAGASVSGTVNDPTPVVTSVSPNTWVAGQTNASFTITGRGFGTAPTLTVTGPSGTIPTTVNSGATDTSFSGTYSVAANSAGGTATVTLTSHGYNGSGFVCGTACTSQANGSNNSILSINPIKVSQSPSAISMSSGDTNQALTIAASPTSVASSEAISYGLSSNPNSNSSATLSFTRPQTFTGNDSWPIVISGSASSSPSGLFTATSCTDGVCSGRNTIITIPPLVLIQVLYGEAYLQPRHGDSVSEPAIGMTIKNRFGSSAFPGGTSSVYQLVITGGQYGGLSTAINQYNITSSMTNNVAHYELPLAVALFTGTQTDIEGDRLVSSAQTRQDGKPCKLH